MILCARDRLRISRESISRGISSLKKIWSSGMTRIWIASKIVIISLEENTEFEEEEKSYSILRLVI